MSPCSPKNYLKNYFKIFEMPKFLGNSFVAIRPKKFRNISAMPTCPRNSMCLRAVHKKIPNNF